MTLQKKTLKVLTFLMFIFLTSFFLNYSHAMVATTWFLKQMVLELSENLKRLIKHRPCTCTHYINSTDSRPGFEASVGSKTTHYLVYPESFWELGDNISMVLVPFKTISLEWVYVFENWLQSQGWYLSTGILLLIFSMPVCDEVDLSSFWEDSKGNWHHYWENIPSVGAFCKTEVHDIDFESNVMATLASSIKSRSSRADDGVKG
ncbi:hypothetical protein P7K49_006423 [Saguinus oedipus]|uniref:beta-D-galactosyl-(1->3)-N-acetyl-beta-D-galactosaminide alpha-2,3-sialyltransferase n=1 Tax=Saguinus oedipus TaxID=9490 RepID=A0ABQ9W2D1_SAGOE|nr:hypothetical protein P7K49_006423 [Saguinus oedipus]